MTSFGGSFLNERRLGDYRARRKGPEGGLPSLRSSFLDYVNSDDFDGDSGRGDMRKEFHGNM